MTDKDEAAMGHDDKNLKDGNLSLEELTIEESFEALEDILGLMEDDKTGLEETFSLYERGLKLIKNVSSSIDRVEKKIQILEEEEQP